MANSKPTLGYWALRGLGQPIRFMVAYLGLDINEKRYSITNFAEWHGDTGEKLKLGLDFPNLPYWIDGDFKLTESRAIAKHIARGTALTPTSGKDAAVCDMVENVLWDIWFALLRYCNYGFDEFKKYLENDVSKKLDYLETFLNSKKFVLGENISYVDFFLYEMLYHFSTHDKTYLDKYPTLGKYKKNFEEVPAIAKYIASKEYIASPCINPMAKFAF